MRSRPSGETEASSEQSFEKRVIERLREQGFRITTPRTQVIRALAHSNRALSAYAIHESIIAAGNRIDVVSVYRILSTLVELGLIHHVGVVDGYMACRMGEEHLAQTEHIICRNCGNVAELEFPIAVQQATSLQLREIDFEAITIKVEILGCCSACASA